MGPGSVVRVRVVARTAAAVGGRRGGGGARAAAARASAGPQTGDGALAGHAAHAATGAAQRARVRRGRARDVVQEGSRRGPRTLAMLVTCHWVHRIFPPCTYLMLKALRRNELEVVACTNSVIFCSIAIGGYVLQRQYGGIALLTR